ncbi:aldose 1-epimerase [Phtheirospermum japonicum]|uniref:Aldose 1-epimerase n=1 Tax=Phtheirospermum japonicum TaxID=374723 RepID=A0A830CK41_9LAMI|nr:aldose 1-epimerase [Phtheirospermum japonicum]
MEKSLLCFSLVTVAFALVNVCKADEEIGIYELQRGHLSINITNYGATVLNVVVPDKNGKLDDVVLGFGSIDDYKNDTTYFGALVGRVANRIGGAQFTLNGKVYKLPANDHGNTLHGGSKGFSDVTWTVREHVKDSHLTLTYDSHDGEQGFPGELSVTVTYLLLGQNKFAIRMQAQPTTKPSPVNLASHSYWNLGGHASGNILNSHTIQLFASRITPVNDKLIPTGEISPVEGTPYDFLEPRTIGSKLPAGGYDINYVLDRTGAGEHLTKVATVRDEKTGRKMELWSDQAGVQFYTSNMLKDTVGKGGVVYRQYGAFCLETQGYPDSVNHHNFPSQIVNPGESYRNVMVYRFTAS